MSERNQDLDALAPELQTLLEQSRADVSAPPAAVRDRLLQRIEMTLALPVTGAAGEAGASASSAETTGAGAWVLRKWPLAATMFALGAGSGALVHSVVRGDRGSQARPAVSVTPVPADAPAPAPSPLAAPVPAGPLVAPEEAVQPPASGPVARAARPSAPDHDTELAAERALIETARSAVARGESASALAILERHAREYRQGRLSEEREVLLIQALATSGDLAQARTRGARFRKNYPRSLFLPVVDEVLRSIP